MVSWEKGNKIVCVKVGEKDKWKSRVEVESQSRNTALCRALLIREEPHTWLSLLEVNVNGETDQYSQLLGILLV